MSVEKLLGDLKNREFAYDDVLVAQGRKTTFFESDIDLTTKVSRNIVLKIPIVSAAMDTVCEHEMAIALALLGGIGTIHYNFGQRLDENIEKQLAEVKKVKRYENGFVENPITVSPSDTIDKVAQIRKEHGISAIPVTEDGQPKGRLVGFIHKEDYSIKLHAGKLVKDRMVKDPVTATWESLQSNTQTPLEMANNVLLESHKSALPVIDKDGKLMYLVTRADIEKNENYPNATKDSNKRLRVIAAVETRMERAMARFEALSPFVDAFLVDTAHAHFKPVYDIIEAFKAKYNNDLIIGNASMPSAVCELAVAGADGIRVGTGPGGGCQTWDAAGTGREQASAVYHCVQAMRAMAVAHQIPMNADGGIERSGDITIAIALGSSSVTLGSMLAGTNEAPGEYEMRKGVRVKKYRGMGSIEAMAHGGAHRYNLEGAQIRVPEGGVRFLQSKGSAYQWIQTLVQGLKQGMFKAGCRTIEEMHEYAQLLPADKRSKREKHKFEE